MKVISNLRDNIFEEQEMKLKKLIGISTDQKYLHQKKVLNDLEDLNQNQQKTKRNKRNVIEEVDSIMKIGDTQINLTMEETNSGEAEKASDKLSEKN